jgi:hypothetical protein
MKKILLLLTFFTLTLFVNAQDKVGHGSDAEGCDSAGVGTVTTWVKHKICCGDGTGNCLDYNLLFQLNWGEPYNDTINIISLSTAMQAIDLYKERGGGSGSAYSVSVDANSFFDIKTGDRDFTGFDKCFDLSTFSYEFWGIFVYDDGVDLFYFIFNIKDGFYDYVEYY